MHLEACHSCFELEVSVLSHHGTLKEKGGWIQSANSWQKTFYVKGILCKSPSTNLSRKGNSMSDDSLDGITFSIAQGSTFFFPRAPGDTSLRVGLWIQAVSKGQPRQKIPGLWCPWRSVFVETVSERCWFKPVVNPEAALLCHSPTVLWSVCLSLLKLAERKRTF